VFGFLATFEPLERSVQLAWRRAYFAAGVAALAGMVWALNKDRTRRRRAGSDGSTGASSHPPTNAP